MHPIKAAEVSKAHRVFRQFEPRDLFYRAATELVSLSLNARTRLSVAEALAVLLQTWNRPYYRYRKFDAAHFEKIEEVWRSHKRALKTYRNRAIDTLSPGERESICSVFNDFEIVLGPVGAAKALHLLAPRFFPLWDRAIANAYGCPLGPVKSNAIRFWAFMLKIEGRCRRLSGGGFRRQEVLKAIDEYNYCKYTKGWL